MFDVLSDVLAPIGHLWLAVFRPLFLINFAFLLYCLGTGEYDTGSVVAVAVIFIAGIATFAYTHELDGHNTPTVQRGGSRT